MKKVLVVVTILLGGVALLTTLKKNAPPTSPLPLPSFGVIHDFELTRETGAPFQSAELKSKVWIASFMFTRCQGPCPLMSQKLARLQKDLAGNPNIRFLSITMDPAYDSPEVLRAYGEKYAANPQFWYFLTGEKEDIIRIATEAFKLPAGEDPDMHSTRFVLVDGQGTIRGYYDSTATTALDALKQHAQNLAAVPSV